MKSKQITITIDAWIEDHAKMLAQENFKLLKSITKSQGNKISKKLANKFLAHFVEILVSDSLNELPEEKLSNEDIYRFTSHNFLTLKIQIQDEISEAFRLGLGKYTGHPVDYYCIIKPIPQPLNKEPC